MQFGVPFQPILVSTDLTKVWINIPKNASSFTQKVLTDNGWKEPPKYLIQSILNTSIEKTVILRDPVQRWISGFSECFMENPDVIDLLDNESFWTTIEKNPVFDNHTEFQSTFVNELENVRFIYMNQNENASRFYSALQSWVLSWNGSANFSHWSEKTNPHTNHPVKKQIYTKLLDLVKLKYKPLLTDLHWQDYELIEKKLTRIYTYGN